ncbi:cytochrome c biogenesis protein CcsA [Pseudobacteriovorax antillogorgiicola]|uniref:ABC-type uncharacterized transport system, permease component n=1 Tax=Pseudobacteriovorax antillogorgiicola TaxID=1513793 RepID=A0A1Y6B8M8_9BACT|nr:cytochrome c biogenesis protein CcsA [Pseudobacteriovorax antillogorgiicola]TCS58825.1 ABC-type uncharacterized transport system permease subunit [Pseudobacteriovorax antillogorgiicola]SME94236.1 ABC-type uncharacterized transport system, permease component [Pseudobacteriovorax antillogorgiicola]
MNPSHFSIVTSLVSFAIASGCYLHAFSTEKHKKLLNKIAYSLFIFATFLMTHVSIMSIEQGIHNVASGFLLITIVAWITLLAQMLFRIQTAGTFIAPIITLITLIHLLTASPHSAPQQGPQGLLAFHIYTSVTGQAFAILAMAIAILFIVQQRAMKKKQLHRLLGSTLSISTLEKALLFCLWAGFIFLTTGLVLGAVWTQFYSGSETEITSKVVWALLVWTWYLLTLLAKNVFKIAAKKVALMTFVGFGIMALGFFGLLTN